SHRVRESLEGQPLGVRECLGGREVQLAGSGWARWGGIEFRDRPVQPLRHLSGVVFINPYAERFAVGIAHRFVGRDQAADSSKIFGFLCAIVSSVRAGPEGARRPCSHSWRVLTDTPSSRANSACERPV